VENEGTGTGKRTVRTTMQPDRDIEVDEAEYTDLLRQGLLLREGGEKIPAATDPPVEDAPSEVAQPVNEAAESTREQPGERQPRRGTGGRA
jgi:hypothetical protein